MCFNVISCYYVCKMRGSTRKWVRCDFSMKITNLRRNKLKWVVNFIKTGVYCPALLGIWESNNFFRISNHDDLDISLPVFPSRTNLKQCNIFAVPKLVRKVITNFDLSNASDLDSITVVVLKNSEPKHSYILAELFNMCLKESHL